MRSPALPPAISDSHTWSGVCPWYVLWENVVMIDRAAWAEVVDRVLVRLRTMPGGLLPILHAIQERSRLRPAGGRARRSPTR